MLQKYSNDIKTADNVIGIKRPCFIIAEAGVNHNSSVRLARRLVDAAAKVGADAGKRSAIKEK